MAIADYFGDRWMYRLDHAIGQTRHLRQMRETLDLRLLAVVIGRRQRRRPLESAHFVSQRKPLGEKVHKSGVEIIDSGAEPLQVILMALCHDCES